MVIRIQILNAPDDHDASQNEFYVRQMPFVIGRDEGCDLVLNDAALNISRHHAELLFDERHGLIVKDLSLGGTVVNGKQLRKGDEEPIAEGDRVQIGEFELIFGDGSTVVEQRQPEVAVDRAPAFVSEPEPTASPEPSKPAPAERAPVFSADRKPAMVADRNPKAPADKKPVLAAKKEPGFSAKKEPPVAVRKAPQSGAAGVPSFLAKFDDPPISRSKPAATPAPPPRVAKLLAERAAQAETGNNSELLYDPFADQPGQSETKTAEKPKLAAEVPSVRAPRHDAKPFLYESSKPLKRLELDANPRTKEEPAPVKKPAPEAVNGSAQVQVRTNGVETIISDAQDSGNANLPVPVGSSQELEHAQGANAAAIESAVNRLLEMIDPGALEDEYNAYLGPLKRNASNYWKLHKKTFVRKRANSDYVRLFQAMLAEELRKQ